MACRCSDPHHPSSGSVRRRRVDPDGRAGRRRQGNLRLGLLHVARRRLRRPAGRHLVPDRGPARPERQRWRRRGDGQDGLRLATPRPAYWKQTLRCEAPPPSAEWAGRRVRAMNVMNINIRDERREYSWCPWFAHARPEIVELCGRFSRDFVSSREIWNPRSGLPIVTISFFSLSLLAAPAVQNVLRMPSRPFVANSRRIVAFCTARREGMDLPFTVYSTLLDFGGWFF